MRIVAIMIILVVAVIAALFSVLNAGQVAIDFYFRQDMLPLSLIVVMTLVIGIILGIVACLGLLLRIKQENVRLKKNIKVTEKELANLRRMPFKDDA